MGDTRLRGIAVTIEVDTSHRTRRDKLELDDDETVEEFGERVKDRIEELCP